jgi:hypothetical protein
LQVIGAKQTVPIPPFTPPHAFQPLGGVAVIADNTWAAFKGRNQLKVEWENGSHASYTSGEYEKQLQETARQPGKVVDNIGDVDSEFAQGGKTVEAEYFAPHLAHASMEPPVAVADVQGDKVTVWCPTQDPQGVQVEVAKGATYQKGRRALPRDSSGRRLRPEIETGLRSRSSDLIEKNRPSGEACLEQGRRNQVRLLPTNVVVLECSSKIQKTPSRLALLNPSSRL